MVSNNTMSAGTIKPPIMMAQGPTFGLGNLTHKSGAMARRVWGEGHVVNFGAARSARPARPVHSATHQPSQGGVKSELK